MSNLDRSSRRPSPADRKRKVVRRSPSNGGRDRPRSEHRRHTTDAGGRPSLTFFSEFWEGAEGVLIVQLVPCPQCAPDLGEGPYLERFDLRRSSGRESFESYVAAHRDLGRLHFSPLLRDPDAENLRAVAACLPGAVCWIDVDHPTTPEAIEEKLSGVPAAIVASGSPGHHQIHVRLDRDTAVDDIRELNRALADVLDGDRGATSPHQLMAIPDTLNHKPCESGGEPELVRLLTSGDDAERAPIEEVLALAPRRSRKPARSEPMERPGGDSGMDRDLSELPAYVLDVANEDPGQHRGPQSYHAVAVFVEYGLGDAEIHRNAEQIKSLAEKFEGRSEQEVDRILDKLRPEHPHAGQTCAQADCPNTPNWMDEHRELDPFPGLEPLKEFMEQVDARDDLVEGLIPHPTYGQIAGASKTLKTYLALDLVVAVATGTKFLGRFAVVTSGPVVLYINEGRREELQTRIRKLLALRNLKELPEGITIRYQGAHLTTEKLIAQLRWDLRRQKPALVILDPFYAFFDGDVDATNLLQTGPFLRRFSSAALEAGASLLIVNHFRKCSGKEPQLSDITQSGGGEWVDSWALVSKLNQTEDDVTLVVKFGARGRGERRLIVRAVNALASDPEAEFSWKVSTNADNYREKVLEVLRSDGPLNKTQLRKEITGSNSKVDAAIGELLDEGAIRKDGHNFDVSPDM